MPSTYDPLLNLELQAGGENANLWGDKLNSNLSKLAQAIDAYFTISLSFAGATYTLSNLQGSLDESCRANYSFQGKPGIDVTVIFPARQKRFIASNDTVTGINIILSTGSGSTLVLNPGDRVDVICDGTNMIHAVTTIGASTSGQNFQDITVSNTATVGGTFTVNGTSKINGPISGNVTVQGNLSVGATLTASTVSFTNPVGVSNGGTGATTAAQARINLGLNTATLFFNVRDYGAVGDGSTDDSGALQRAINAAVTAGGGTVYVPPSGNAYRLNVGLFLPAGVTLKGCGAKGDARSTTPYTTGSWLNPRDASNAAVWMIAQNGPRGSGAGSRVEGINFFYIQPPEPVTPVTTWTPTRYPYTIQMTDQYQTIDNIQILWASHGISCNGSNVTGGNAGGVGCMITNCDIAAYNVGISVDLSIPSLIISNINIDPLGGPSIFYYTLGNLFGLDFHHADNILIHNVSILGARIGIACTNGTDGSNHSLWNAHISNLETNLCGYAIVALTVDTAIRATFTSCLFQGAPLSSLVTPLSPPPDVSRIWLLFLNSDNVTCNFSGCSFVSDVTICELGAGGAGTQNILGFPSCTFSSSEFWANGAGGTAAAFIVNTSAKISTSAQYYRLNGGPKKTGGGVMVEATETTL